MAARFPAMRWFPKDAEIRNYPEAALEVGVSLKDGVKPVAIGYFGKANRPAFNYSFKDAERMEAFVAEKVNSGKAAQKAKAEWLAARKAKLAKPIELKVGDVLATSWGYDQTNVEYFEVVSMVGKRSVIVREIASETVPGSEGFMSRRIKPVPGAFIGEPMMKRVGADGELKMSSWGRWARKVDVNKSAYESWYA